jgi:hypothetical protein
MVNNEEMRGVKVFFIVMLTSNLLLPANSALRVTSDQLVPPSLDLHTSFKYWYVNRAVRVEPPTRTMVPSLRLRTAGAERPNIPVYSHGGLVK